LCEPVALIMISLKSLFVAASLGLSALASPANFTMLDKRQSITGSQTGTVDGYFYSSYIETNTGSTLTLGDGSYSLTWSPSSTDVVCGIGWNPGSAQAITYSGSFNTAGNAYLSVYGWTTNPLVEYYITDAIGDYNPGSAATYKGSVTSDGGTYDIYLAVRTNAPSIDGTATFNQFWSIRTSNRVGGTITTSNHFNAWKSLGLDMGTFNYQILATEGYESSGTSSISVHAGGGTSSSSSVGSSSSSSSSTTTSSAPGATQTEYGQCGGIGWTGADVCASGTTCQELNSYYSQCLA